MNRRTFVQASSLLGGVLATQHLPRFDHKFSTKSQLKIFATNWGFQGSMDDFCALAKKEGYDGIEVWCPGDQKGRDDLRNVTTKHGLEVGLMAGNGGKNYEEMIASYHTYIDNSVAYKPTFINCHSGRDHYSFDQNKAFIEYGQTNMKTSGIPIYHETHRNKILFCTNMSELYLDAYPDIELTLDISHWCVVHGTLLEDQEAAVNRALDHTSHIHSRVGFNNGPQVPEPRAPEYQSAVDAHFAWWDRVVERKAKNNQVLTMTTEFGPGSSGYLWTLPYTKQPLADQWAINVHMMQLWRERYT